MNTEGRAELVDVSVSAKPSGDKHLTQWQLVQVCLLDAHNYLNAL